MGHCDSRRKFQHRGGWSCWDGTACGWETASLSCRVPTAGALPQDLGSWAGEASLGPPEPSRTLWKLLKNMVLTSGRLKVTSCKVAPGTWLK